MAFLQADLVKQANIGQRDAFTSYNYKTDDNIATVTAVGYFDRIPASRFVIEPKDVLRVQTSTGFFICTFLTDTTSAEISLSPSNVEVEEIIEDSVPYTLLGTEDTIELTGTGNITMLETINATKSVIIFAATGTVTLILQGSDTTNQTTITVGNSARYTPFTGEWITT